MSNATPGRILRPLGVLQLGDSQLLAQCDFATFRGSGPGGQKRNKSSSAVRLTHRPTDISAEAGECRSQAENRAAALGRLRWRLAHELRRPGPGALDELRKWPLWKDLRKRDPLRPHATALLFDLLDSHAWALYQVAEALDVSTGQLAGFLTELPETLAAVNNRRRALGLRPLS